jgi:hypothetical protein
MMKCEIYTEKTRYGVRGATKERRMKAQAGKD